MTATGTSERDAPADVPSPDLDTGSEATPGSAALDPDDAAYRRAVAYQLSPPMPNDRLLAWVFAAVVAAAAALVRLYNLHWPDKLVFDEAYYVPEGDQMLRYGFEENRAYYFIVHPPFGKWNIALGQWLFGYEPMGWRFAGVLAGVGSVVLLIFLVRRLTRSTLVGLGAGLLLAADGFSFALSRTGILDIFLQFWVLLGVVLLVLDRDRFRRQLGAAYAAGDTSRWGPRVSFRWWRLAAGIAFGLAISVKWSAAYFLAAFAILSVFWDVGAYRMLRLRSPYVVALRRTLPTALWDLAVVPVLAYLASWAGWFAGETAQGRHWAEGRDTDWPWIPEAIRSLWHMHGEWLTFHNNLSSPHPWESGPWSWLVSARPVLMVNDKVTIDGVEMWRTITMIGTPPLWWAFVPCLLYAAWRLVSRRDWAAGVVLVGVAAGWGSWLINTERTMFLFYMAPVVPFFIVGVALALDSLLGRRRDPLHRRQWGAAAFAVYVAGVVALFLFFLPVLNGTPVTAEERNMRMWMTTWN